MTETTIKVGLPQIRCGKMVDPVVGFRIRRDCCGRDGTFFRMFWQISHRQTWCAAPSILPTEPVVWEKIFCADVHCAPILSYPSNVDVHCAPTSFYPSNGDVHCAPCYRIRPRRHKHRVTSLVSSVAGAGEGPRHWLGRKFTFFLQFCDFLSFLSAEVEIGVGVRPACHLRPPAW